VEPEDLFTPNKKIPQNSYPQKRKGTTLTKTVTREMLEDLYLHQGKSLEDIAKILGCTRPMVQILMERQGILRRNRSRARTLAIKNDKFERIKHHDIDEYFFSYWSPAMAWVLGLLFTDGYVVQSGKGLTSDVNSGHQTFQAASCPV